MHPLCFVSFLPDLDSSCRCTNINTKALQARYAVVSCTANTSKSRYVLVFVLVVTMRYVGSARSLKNKVLENVKCGVHEMKIKKIVKAPINNRGIEAFGVRWGGVGRRGGSAMAREAGWRVESMSSKVARAPDTWQKLQGGSVKEEREGDSSFGRAQVDRLSERSAKSTGYASSQELESSLL